MTLVIVVLVVALRGHPPSLYWQGEPLEGAGSVLSQAQAEMRGLVAADEGADLSQSRCYFSLPNATGHDIAPYLRCGPVYFPWSQPSAAWLTYRLSAQASGPGVKLALAAAPAAPATQALAKGEVLRRPDGSSPPKAPTGLKIPVVPRLPSGWAGLLGPVPPGLRPAPAEDLVGDWGAAYRLVGFGKTGWLGRQYDPGALRSAVAPPGSAYSTTPSSTRPLARLLLPPPGQVFVLAELAVSPGEAAGAVPRDGQAAAAAAGAPPATDQPVLQVRAGGVVAAVPQPAGTGVVTVAAAVPAGATPYLVISDRGLSQALSLADGQLGPGPSVLARAATDQPLNVTGRLGTTTVRLEDASLVWFAGSDGGTVPPSYDQAYLQVLATVSPLSQSFLPAGDFSLEEPGGQVAHGVALPDADRQAIAVGFLVPASFSDGTVVVSAGGQSFGVRVHFP